MSVLFHIEPYGSLPELPYSSYIHAIQNNWCNICIQINVLK